MMALCHDVRIMREDRGFLCANEMQLGMTIPRPELALFRHKLPANIFLRLCSCLNVGRDQWHWVQVLCKETAAVDELAVAAARKAEELAPLANNRANFRAQKESIYGENAAINFRAWSGAYAQNSEQFLS